MSPRGGTAALKTLLDCKERERQTLLAEKDAIAQKFSALVAAVRQGVEAGWPREQFLVEALLLDES